MLAPGDDSGPYFSRATWSRCLMLQPGPCPRRRFIALLAGLTLFGAVGCAPLASTVGHQGESAAPAVVPNPASLGIAQSSVRQTTDMPPGRILYVRDGNLWLWHGGSSHQFSEGGTWSQPSFSPSGK